MLESYQWSECYLLVGLVTRGGGTGGYLLDHVTQEQFFETYAGPDAVALGVREVHACNITMLSEESFYNLSRIWPATRILVGD